MIVCYAAAPRHAFIRVREKRALVPEPAIFQRDIRQGTNVRG